MLKIFLSSTFRDLKDTRSEILNKLNSVFEGVGMEKFIPDGETSHKNCIDDLKESKIVVFLISPYYGSLIDVCELKEDCKADCPMKTGKGQISYTHCEYKTTLAEGILHQTYKVLEGWDAPDVQKDPLKMKFEQEIGKKMWTPIQDIEDPQVVKMIGEHLAGNIIKWYLKKKLTFEKFCDRIEDFDELIKSIDGKVEVYGVGGVGKTSLIQVALLIQKLKGKKIVTIGTPKAYASGSGFEDFRTKCKDDQYEAESRNEITIYDIVNALVKVELLSNAEEILKMPKNEIIEFLSNFIKKEENLTLFIDDFHLANKDVVLLVKSVENIIFSSRKNTYIAKTEICITGIDKEDREDLINLFSAEELPEKAKELIEQIAEGHPVSTELLVKNYQNIDFDNIKDFDLEDPDDEQVMDFYKRVIEEVFSNNSQALVLLKDLAILNTDLPTNINRESVLKSYDIKNIRKVFKNLVDTGMLKKREGQEGTYEFYFKHIQDALENIADKESQEKAIEYYEKKEEIIGESIDDAVEILYHKVKFNPSEELFDDFTLTMRNVEPFHYGYRKLIDIGRALESSLKSEDKASILSQLAALYRESFRLEDAENLFLKSLIIYEELAKKEDFLPKNLATTQNDLGLLYLDLKKYEKAEEFLLKSLNYRENLVEKFPEDYLTESVIQMIFSDVADSYLNLGNLFFYLNNFKEAEGYYLNALKKYAKLADLNPEYLLQVVKAQSNLGVIYTDLNRYSEAEEMLINALDFYNTNSELYLPDIARTKQGLGILYRKMKKYKDSEKAYLEALKIMSVLKKKNPVVYLPKDAMLQINLGILYGALEREEEQQKCYKNALEIYENLARENPDVYLPTLATTQHNISVSYFRLEKYEEAENMALKALKVRKKFAAVSPEAFLPHVIQTLNGLGVIYAGSKRFDEAEKIFLEGIKIFKGLDKEISENTLSEVANIYYNLGKQYVDLKEYYKAEETLFETLNKYKELAKKNPEIFQSELIKTQTSLRELYREIIQIEDSENIYLRALENYTELANSDPDIYQVILAEIHKDLGLLYNYSNKMEDAKISLNKALELFKELMMENSQVYRIDVVQIFSALAEISLNLNELREAEKYYLDSLEIVKELSKENPETYLPLEIEHYSTLGSNYIMLKDLENALKYINQALEIDPAYANALYNKACVESIMNNNVESLDSLRKAIELDKSLADSAKSDDDFDNLRNLKEFKELIGE